MSNSIKLLLNKIRYYLLQTFLRKFFFVISLMTAKATEQASWFPPKVEPCEPKFIFFATLFVISTAPIGKPPPKPLAEVNKSGFILLHW